MEDNLSASTQTLIVEETQSGSTSIHHEIKIRYNNACTDGINFWRAIIDDKEHLFSEIEICVFSQTSKDFIEGVGDKYHISCTGWCVVEGTKLTINPFPTDKDTVL